MGQVISSLSSIPRLEIPSGRNMHFGASSAKQATARISMKAADSPTGSYLMEFQPNDAAVTGTPSTSRSSFYLTLAEIDDGYPEKNRVLGLGCNFSPGGGAVIPGKKALGSFWEGSYLDGGFVEHQLRYLDTAGHQYRLMAFTLSGDVNPNVDLYFESTNLDLRVPSNGAVNSYFTVANGAAVTTKGMDLILKDSSGNTKAQIILNGTYKGYADVQGLAVGNFTSAGQTAGTIYTKSDPTGDIPFLRNIAIPGSGALNNAQVDFVWTTFNGVAGLYMRSMTAHAIGLVGYGASTPMIRFNNSDDYLRLGRGGGATEVRLYAQAADTLQIINGAFKVGSTLEVTSVGDLFSYAYRSSNGSTQLTSASGANHATWLKTISENSSYGQYFSVSRGTPISAITGWANGVFQFETEFSVTSGKVMAFRNNGVNVLSGYHNGVVELAKLNVAGYSSATTPGSVVYKVPFYDNANNLIGYIPVYGSIS